jgi:hypothetical protein
MKARIALVGLSAVLLCSATVQGGGTPGWTKYTSKKGGFSVVMPGTPRESTKTVKTPYDTYEHNLLILADPVNGTAYAIDFTDLPEDLLQGASVETFLDTECDVFLQKAKCKLLSQKAITRGRLLGREIEVELLAGKAISRTRIFLVGRRIYHLSVIMPRAQANAADMERFLDSFGLESPPDGVAEGY